jgi:L-fuconolactonase
MSPPATLDSYLHLWDLAVRDQAWIPAGSPIRRSFDVRDLRSALAGTPVGGRDPRAGHQRRRRDDRLHRLRQERRHRPRRRRLGRPDVAGLRGRAFRPDIHGVPGRYQAPGPGRGRPGGLAAIVPVRRSLALLEAAGLPFDLVIRPAHFPAAREAARDHPGLQFVLDHFGKPSIAARELEPWASGLRALAAEPNIAGKLSGLQTIASPEATYPELAPYIDIALEAFGPSRLIFGSDWPVSSQAAPYSRVCEVARAACSALSGDERAAVLAGNARAIYLAG